MLAHTREQTHSHTKTHTEEVSPLIRFAQMLFEHRERGRDGVREEREKGRGDNRERKEGEVLNTCTNYLG